MKANMQIREANINSRSLIAGPLLSNNINRDGDLPTFHLRQRLLSFFDTVKAFSASRDVGTQVCLCGLECVCGGSGRAFYAAQPCGPKSTRLLFLLRSVSKGNITALHLDSVFFFLCPCPLPSSPLSIMCFLSETFLLLLSDSVQALSESKRPSCRTKLSRVYPEVGVKREKTDICCQISAEQYGSYSLETTQRKCSVLT